MKRPSFLMTRKRSILPRSRKARMITLSLVGFVVVLTGAFGAYWAWNRWQDTHFQAYEPTVMPAGLHITSHNTLADPNSDRYVKIVVLQASDQRINIVERSMQAGKTSQIANPLCPNAGSACQVLHTPKGAPYYVSMEYVRGAPFMKSVSWATGSTLSRIVLAGPHAMTLYPDAIWGDMIDSYVPTDYANSPMKSWLSIR